MKDVSFGFVIGVSKPQLGVQNTLEVETEPALLEESGDGVQWPAKRRRLNRKSSQRAAVAVTQDMETRTVSISIPHVLKYTAAVIPASKARRPSARSKKNATISQPNDAIHHCFDGFASNNIHPSRQPLAELSENPATKSEPVAMCNNVRHSHPPDPCAQEGVATLDVIRYVLVETVNDTLRSLSPDGEGQGDIELGRRIVRQYGDEMRKLLSGLVSRLRHHRDLSARLADVKTQELLLRARLREREA